MLVGAVHARPDTACPNARYYPPPNLRARTGWGSRLRVYRHATATMLPGRMAKSSQTKGRGICGDPGRRITIDITELRRDRGRGQISWAQRRPWLGRLRSALHVLVFTNSFLHRAFPLHHMTRITGHMHAARGWQAKMPHPLTTPDTHNTSTKHRIQNCSHDRSQNPCASKTGRGPEYQLDNWQPANPAPLGLTQRSLPKFWVGTAHHRRVQAMPRVKSPTASPHSCTGHGAAEALTCRRRRCAGPAGCGRRRARGAAP